MAYFGEIHPPRRDRVGDNWGHWHTIGMTDTGYTSWSADRSIAEAAAQECCDAEGLAGGITMFRVPTKTLDPDLVFEGRDDEVEFLIQGTVENVEVSAAATDEEDYE